MVVEALLLRPADCILIDNTVFHIFSTMGPKIYTTTAEVVMPQNCSVFRFQHGDTLSRHLCLTRILMLGGV